MFDAKKMELKLVEGSLKITKELLSDMLGIKNKGIDINIIDGDGKRNEEMLRSWMEKYDSRKDITPGEIEEQFVEQDDPMTDTKEGYEWKLNKYSNSISRERYNFEKTLAAPENMFTGYINLAAFFMKYMDALNYQRCRNQGSVDANSSDENRATEAGEYAQNNKGANSGSVEAMIVEGIQSLRDADVDSGVEKGTEEELLSWSPNISNCEIEEPFVERNDHMPDTKEGYEWNLNKYINFISVQSLGDADVDSGKAEGGMVNENKFGSPTCNMGLETQTLANELVDYKLSFQGFNSPNTLWGFKHKGRLKEV
ncbi:hypothetical protein Tco_0000884 [Tanacetum coccineum]